MCGGWVETRRSRKTSEYEWTEKELSQAENGIFIDKDRRDKVVGNVLLSWLCSKNALLYSSESVNVQKSTDFYATCSPEILLVSSASFPLGYMISPTLCLPKLSQFKGYSFCDVIICPKKKVTALLVMGFFFSHIVAHDST